MTECYFTDIEIHGDSAHPTLVRGFCSTCAGERSLRFKGGGTADARLVCSACGMQEHYDPEGLLSD